MSKTKLTMRTKAHKIKVIIIGFAVDQDKVWPDMTIPMVTPITRKRMITKT